MCLSATASIVMQYRKRRSPFVIYLQSVVVFINSCNGMWPEHVGALRGGGKRNPHLNCFRMLNRSYLCCRNESIPIFMFICLWPLYRADCSFLENQVCLICEKRAASAVGGYYCVNRVAHRLQDVLCALDCSHDLPRKLLLHFRRLNSVALL